MTTKPKPRLIPESTILAEAQLAATAAGARVWRNNVGLLYTQDGRPVRVGLVPGSADLIGLTATGRFLAIECKRPQGGRVSKEQQHWLDFVTGMGGLAIVARSGQDVTDALNEEAARDQSEHDDYKQLLEHTATLNADVRRLTAELEVYRRGAGQYERELKRRDEELARMRSTP